MGSRSDTHALTASKRGKWVGRLLVGATTVLIAVSLVACGGGDSGGGSTIVVGTTDPPDVLDPAGANGIASFAASHNLYGTLLEIPPKGTEAKPSLAESCDWEDPTTYTCTLKEGLKFQDGTPITSADVKSSIERIGTVESDGGPSYLVSALEEVQTPDKSTAVFKLAYPSSTWPFILTTGAASIVPESYSPKTLTPNDQGVSSGPYQLEQFKPGEQMVLEKNPEWSGVEPQNDRVIVKFFSDSNALKLAIESGEVDIAYRTLTPTDITSLGGDGEVEVLEGAGGFIRYLVLNQKLEPVNNKAVRQAMAYLINRDAIVEDVYEDTVEPLYSMIPNTLPYHIDSYAERYGTEPNPAKARETLEKAGVSTPVPVDIWYTPTHYGAITAQEMAVTKRALEEDDLFKVTLDSTEYSQFLESGTSDQYPVWQFGWFPDYLDADDFSYSFYQSENAFLNTHYDSPKVDELLYAESETTDKKEREDAFAEIQRTAAEDVPTIPLFEEKQIAVVRKGIKGVQETLDPSYIFRYWLISKE